LIPHAFAAAGAARLANGLQQKNSLEAWRKRRRAMRIPDEQGGSNLWQQAREFCSAEQCEAAIGALEQQASTSTDPDAHYQLGLCYTGACRRHPLVDPEIACTHFRQALAIFPPGKRAERAATLGALGNAFQDATRLPRRGRLVAAIKCHERAAAIYAELEEPDDWAREEYNLGNAFSDLPEREFPRKWQEAITHYKRALGVRTRERSPRHHAATLLNLGAAYRELAAGDRSENLKRAIGCYRRALAIYTAEAFPEQNASLHNNLGNAYLTLGQLDPGSAAHCAERALRHFDLALGARSRDRRPCDYAVTQLNRGEAFVEMLETDPTGCLKKASESFGEAERCFALCGLTSFAERARARRAEVEAALASLAPPGGSCGPAGPEGKKTEGGKEGS
jgi:tetratricopeptide (TPR) repeat protein